MKIKSFLIWLSDIFWLKIVGGNHIKELYKERTSNVCEAILSLFSEDEPYIIEGKYNWCRDSITGIHLPLTVVLPEKKLAVMAWGPEVGTWDVAKLYCKDKSQWELLNRLRSQYQLICESVDMTSLEILWDEPIDIESLTLKFSKLVPKDKLNDGRI